MIFEITKASALCDDPVIKNFNTLEELADFANSVDEALVITFPNIKGHYRLKTNDPAHGVIIIYDDYIE